MTARFEVVAVGDGFTVYHVFTELRKDPCAIRVDNGIVGRCNHHPFENCGGPSRLRRHLGERPQPPLTPAA